MKSQSVRSTPFLGKLFALLTCASMVLVGCVTAESETSFEDVDDAEQELGDSIDAEVEADPIEYRSHVDQATFDAEQFEGVGRETVGPFEQKAAPGEPGEDRKGPDPHPWAGRKSSTDDDDDPVYFHSNAI